MMHKIVYKKKLNQKKITIRLTQKKKQAKKTKQKEKKPKTHTAEKIIICRKRKFNLMKDFYLYCISSKLY